MVNQIYIDGSGHKKARPVTNREQYLSQRNSQDNIRNFRNAREGDKKAKRRLLQYNYNDLLPDGVLRGCNHAASTFAHDIDCGDELLCKEIAQKLMEKKEEIGLLELSVSSGWGLHAVCRREKGKTILESQVRLSMLTETEMDTSTHDEQRVLYTGPADKETLLFLDDAIFEESLTIEESAEEYKRLKGRERQGQEDVPSGAKKANKHYKPWEESEMSEVGSTKDDVLSSARMKDDGKCQMEDDNSQCSMLNAQCSEVDERIRFIAQSVMKEKKLEESFFRDVGGRHTAVKIFLSGATQLLTKAEANGILAELMPQHWNDENIQQLVNDFYKNYTDPNRKLLQYQEQIFTQSRQLSNQPSTASRQYEQFTPPEMPEKLPKLIQLLTSNTPDMYKAAVAHAVFPPLATHLCNVNFLYTDNTLHEATLMNCLMAGTGSGKGCIDKPIACIMADIKKRDKENEDREKEWKIDCRRRGDNKDKKLRPEGLVIQIIDPDMTKPALVTRMDESEGHFVYVKLNELDLFEQLKGQTGKQHFQLMCLAFDPGAEYGQTRIGTQSVTARPMCRFNWNACTTIMKGRRFFRKVLTDGPISRINFCTIPEQELGAEQPIYGQYDEEFNKKLKPYIDNLCAANGFIDCPQAFRLAKNLLKKCAEFARLSQNDVYWNLSHRACVIAWLKACVLYVANGQKWEKSIDEFIMWSLNYDLWCKMQFFGADIAKANGGDDARIGTRGPRNLLELLPDEFTIDDAKRVRQQQGLNNEGRKCQNMISQWLFRKYVLQITDYSFKKSNNNYENTSWN